MPLDELPPKLADELEIIAAEALRAGPGVEGRLKRDITVAIRRYNPLAEVRIENRGGGIGVLLILPSPRNRVRRIRFSLEGL